LIRPLLCLSKKEILEYLQQEDLSYRIDKSNLSPRFTRNWIRKELLPLLKKRNPAMESHLGGLAASLQKLQAD